MFRLIRRTILCLLVGVTAFGVSGWLLRPMPNWSVELDDHEQHEFVPGETPPSKEDPIWITQPHDDDHPRESAVAFSTDDGRLLKTVSAREEWFWLHSLRAPNGRLQTKFEVEEGDEHFTEFEITDARADVPPMKQKLEGKWKSSDNGRTAWRLNAAKAGFVLEVVDLSTGKPLHRLDCSNAYPHLDRKTLEEEELHAVSASAQWIAVCETARTPAKRPAGLEVWDVEKGTMAHRIMPPEWYSPEPLREVVRPAFRPFDRLEYLAVVSKRGGGSAKSWWFDVRTGKHFYPYWEPTGPHGFSGTESYTEDGEEWIRTAYDEERQRAWFAVYKREDRQTEWRRIPAASSTDGPQDASGLKVMRLPGKNEFIANAWQPPMTAALPESLQFLVPDFWKSDDLSMRSYWHDWDRNRWLDVGLNGIVEGVQLRPNALLAIVAMSDGTRRLQSWPLPPRDPKMPAAAIAIASSVGVWWLCRRSAARKKAKT